MGFDEKKEEEAQAAQEFLEYERTTKISIMTKTKARDAKFAKNRSDQLKFLEEIESKSDVKNPWEAVVSLIDLQPKSEDESDKNLRMKNMLIQMKAATSGPGIPA